MGGFRGVLICVVCGAGAAFAQPVTGMLSTRDGGVVIVSLDGKLKPLLEDARFAEARFEKLPIEVTVDAGTVTAVEVESLGLWARLRAKLKGKRYEGVQSAMTGFTREVNGWRPGQHKALAESAAPLRRELAVAFSQLSVADKSERKALLQQYVAMERTLRASAIYGTDDAAPPATYREIFNGSASVGGLASINGGGDRPFCSVVLVARDLVLTAYHCVSKASPPSLEVWFNFTGEPGALAEKIGVERMIGAPGTTPGGQLNDFALLRLKRKVTSTQPACLAMREPRRGDAVYVVGHPKSGTKLVYDNAFVLFPFRVTDDERAQLQLAVEAEVADDPAKEAELRQFIDSYVKPAGSSTWENYSLHWGGQPTIGVDTDTGHGNSGSPLFLRADRLVVGLLYAGEPDLSTPYAPGWKTHEAVIPISRVVSELDRSAGSWRSGVCFK